MIDQSNPRHKRGAVNLRRNGSLRNNDGPQPPSTEPHNSAAEAHVLGHILSDNGVFEDVAAILSPSDFHAPWHEAIFKAAGELIAEGRVADPVTLAPQIPEWKEKHEGISDYVFSLQESFEGDKATTLAYADEIRRYTTQRRLRTVGEKLKHDAYSRSASIADIVAAAMNGISSAAMRADAGKLPVDALEFDHEIELPTTSDAIVKGVLHERDLCFLYGSSRAGKTFVALYLGYHIALGRDFCGRRVTAGAVLYVGLEGQRGLRKRMLAAKAVYGSAGRMFARMTVATPLDRSAAGAVGVSRIVAAAKQQAEAAGAPVRLVIIDTLARAVAGDDENSAQDMAAFVELRVAEITRQTGAAVLVVHHVGKDTTRGMRGSYALLAAADAMIHVTDEKSVELVKVKDGPEGTLFTFRRKEIVLGRDADGADITSCVVETVESDKRPIATQKRLPDQAKRALDILKTMYADGHTVNPSAQDLGLTDPEPNRLRVAVDYKKWKAQCETMCLSEGNPEAERRAFTRASDTLVNRGIVCRYGHFVWLPDAMGHGGTRPKATGNTGVWTNGTPWDNRDECPTGHPEAARDGQGHPPLGDVPSVPSATPRPCAMADDG